MRLKMNYHEKASCLHEHNDCEKKEGFFTKLTRERLSKVRATPRFVKEKSLQQDLDLVRLFELVESSRRPAKYCMPNAEDVRSWM
jgi:hypothetical protein